MTNLKNRMVLRCVSQRSMVVLSVDEAKMTHLDFQRLRSLGFITLWYRMNGSGQHKGFEGQNDVHVRCDKRGLSEMQRHQSVNLYISLLFYC